MAVCLVDIPGVTLGICFFSAYQDPSTGWILCESLDGDCTVSDETWTKLFIADQWLTVNLPLPCPKERCIFVTWHGVFWLIAFGCAFLMPELFWGIVRCLMAIEVALRFLIEMHWASCDLCGRCSSFLYWSDTTWETGSFGVLDFFSHSLPHCCLTCIGQVAIYVGESERLAALCCLNVFSHSLSHCCVTSLQSCQLVWCSNVTACSGMQSPMMMITDVQSCDCNWIQSVQLKDARCVV